LTTCDSFYAISKAITLKQLRHYPKSKEDYPNKIVLYLSDQEWDLVKQAMKKVAIRSSGFGRAAVLLLTRKILTPPKQEPTDED